MDLSISRIHIISLLVLISLQLASCRQRPESPDQTLLARVGEKKLTLNQARRDLPDYQLKNDSARTLLNYRNRWIRRQLMLQEARRVNIMGNRSVQEKIEKMKADIYIEALQNYVLKNRSKQIATSRKEARNYYQQHKEKFILNERHVRFRHMITSTLSAAEKARSQLLGGISWPEVARRYHVNPHKALNQSDRFKPISMAATEAPRMHQFLEVIGIKEISPIRYIKGQYHFVQLMEERPKGDNPDLEWMLNHIESWLQVKKKKQELNAYIKNLYLRARANNEISTPDVFDEDMTGNKNFEDTSNVPTHE